MKVAQQRLAPLRRRLLRGAFALLAILLPLLVIVLGYANRPLAGLADERVFAIAPGTPLAALSEELGELGVINHPLLFSAMARLQGAEKSISQGEYLLPAGATPAELLAMFVAGEVRQHRLTLVEGWTFQQALAEIQASEAIKAELAGASLEEIARRMNLEVSSPEGMIFPDTYFHAAGDSDLQLLLRAHSRLEAVLEGEWNSRAADLPLASAYEALILASIVEKEASDAGQRELIAGVFVNRIEQGMRLQSDPTVIYGLGERFDGDLRTADLNDASAHNTYRNHGLPPSPISLAGLGAIRASLQPRRSDYLYFVSTNDGGHHFSRSLQEHNAAVDCYQRSRQEPRCKRLEGWGED